LGKTEFYLMGCISVFASSLSTLASLGQLLKRKRSLCGNRTLGVDSLALGSCRWQGTHSLDIALAVELDDKVIDEETLLDETLIIFVCARIMIIDQESNVIRLVHYTAEEYFQRKRLVEFPTVRRALPWVVLKLATLLMTSRWRSG
jgi:hypothetical protein